MKTEQIPSPEGIRCITEGQRIAKTIERVTNLFRDAYHGTLITSTNHVVDEEDAERVQMFLQEAFPEATDNFRTHSHLQTTARFAAEIAKSANLNEHEFRILGLIHDIGRLLTHPEGVNPHRYFRNDLLGNVLLKKLKIPTAILAKLQPQRSYIHPEEFADIEKFTPEQRIVMLADICGKRKANGNIQAFTETLAYHYESRDKLAAAEKGPWPSQNTARSVATTDVVDQWGRLYVSLAAWVLSEYGIDIEKLRQKINDE